MKELVQQAARLLGQVPVVSQIRLEAASAALAVNTTRGQERLPKSRQEQIVAAHDEGLRHTVIAEKFHVHRSTVTRVLRAAGIGPAGPALPASAAREVRACYAAGSSVTATAQQFGVSRNTMLHFMSKNGIERRATYAWHQKA